MEKKDHSKERGNNPQPRIRLCSLLHPVLPPVNVPGSSPARLNAINQFSTKWANGTTIKWCFYTEEGLPLINDIEVQKEIVRQAWKTWKNVGIGLEFLEVTDPQDSHVRIAFIDGYGSYSAVGTRCRQVRKTEHTMNLGWDLREGINTPGTALHEIGHALGLEHEHQNPVAGIVWDRDAVYSWAEQTQGWNHQVTNDNILDKIYITPPHGINPGLGTKFDTESIMLYAIPVPGLVKEPQQFQNGISQKNPGTLSDLDKKFIAQLYPPINTPATDPNELAAFEMRKLTIGAGQTVIFTYHCKISATHTISTSGSADILMVLSELNPDGKTSKQLAADDDSLSGERNAKISWKMSSGTVYRISLRMYSRFNNGVSAVVVTYR